MVYPEVRAVGAELLGSDGELDRLEQRVGRGAYLRTGRISPVPERQEPDLLQQQISSEHPVSSRVFDRPLDRGELSPKSTFSQ
jgi:hypothetical protein